MLSFVVWCVLCSSVLGVADPTARNVKKNYPKLPMVILYVPADGTDVLIGLENQGGTRKDD